MMPLGNHTYTGETADYGVTVIYDRGTTAVVEIVEHDSKDCTIPIGTRITVSTERII